MIGDYKLALKHYVTALDINQQKPLRQMFGILQCLIALLSQGSSTNKKSSSSSSSSSGTGTGSGSSSGMTSSNKLFYDEIRGKLDECLSKNEVNPAILRLYKRAFEGKE
eukprot:TRINITY_DN5252_c0_g1_i5.p4 TRINITY_DN5252_c0_g1~~TRINITY_DN5252_c0_g1_i5.p4  ORF type:complete len:109 (+),score=45.39 TRINITY_DN5252_c0_g1_i5:708-1034(+)